VKVTIIGKGRVGTAFATLCEKRAVLFEHLEFIDEYVGDADALFLALPDGVVQKFLATREQPKSVVVHFAAALGAHGVSLLHPYASITSATDLTQILFTLWGEKNSLLEKFLHDLDLSFYYGGTEVDNLSRFSGACWEFHSTFARNWRFAS